MNPVAWVGLAGVLLPLVILYVGSWILAIRERNPEGVMVMFLVTIVISFMVFLVGISS